MALVLTSLARASKVLTISTGVPTANDTVTVGASVYTAKASVSTTANEYYYGATIAEAADNLAAVINAGPTGSGVTWGSLTVANTACYAVSDGISTVTVYAINAGAMGNNIPIAESGTHTAWASSAVFLTGGVGTLTSLLTTTLTTIRDAYQANAQVQQKLSDVLTDLAA